MNTKASSIAAAALLAVAGSTAAQAQAPSVMGTWLTAAGNAHVKLEPCPDAAQGPLCGTIVALPAPKAPDGSPVAPEAVLDFRNPDASLRTRKVLGMMMLWGFKKAGNGFEEGKIYSSADGKTYTANVTLQADGSLKLRGYVGTPLFGQDQIWTRVK